MNSIQQVNKLDIWFYLFEIWNVKQIFNTTTE